MDNHSTCLDEELASIILLPLNDTAEASSATCTTSLTDRLLSKKRQEHDAVLDEMRTSFKSVNDQITEDTWTKSRTLQTHLGNMKGEIEQWLDDNVRSDEDKLLELGVDIFTIAKKKVQQYNTDRLDIIQNFYQTLKRIEKKRSDQFKSILKDCYGKLEKISFKLPNELLEFFDREILHINEIFLDNHRHYLDFYTRLRLQTEDHQRVLLLELREIEDRHKITTKRMTLRGLVDLKFLDHDIYLSSSDLSQDRTAVVVAKFSGVVNSPSTVDFSIWSRQIQETLDVLDGSAKKLLDLYKMAVVNIFNRFFGELQKITNLLEDEGSAGSIQVHYVQSEVFKPMVEDMAQRYTCGVTDLQNLWDSLTSYMQTNLKNTHLFLDTSSHLWDAHFDRMTEIHSLTLQDLKNTIDKNDKAAQDYERKINRTVDLLRQAPTLPKLDSYLKETNKFLDSIADLCSKQCQTEIDVLKKYHHLTGEEIEVLLSEMRRFLGEFSQEKRKRLAAELPGSLDDNMLPRQIKSCKYQVDAVSNWMTGLWEAIRLYMVTCKKELMEQATLWVDNQVAKLKKRLEVRMAVHKPRYGKIERVIYEVRLKELADHVDTLRKVEEAILEHVDSSRDEIQKCRREQVKVLQDFEAELGKLEEKMRSAKRSLQVQSLTERVRSLGKERKAVLEDNFGRNTVQIQERVTKIKGSLQDVSCSMKLFSEGGNYSHDEVKTLLKILAKANKGFPKKFTKVFEEKRAMEVEIFQDFNKLQSDLIERMESSKLEFEHNERVILKIRALRDDIHRKVHGVKYRLMKIESSVEYFTLMSKVELWKRKNFQIMKTSLVQCLEKMNELTAYLSNDYTEEMLELIEKSLVDVEQMSRAFYQDHGHIINTGKIQPTHEMFMEEVTGKYDGYRKQVKINGLECSEELIEHILRLLKINDQVHEDLLKKYPEAVVDSTAGYEQLCEKLSRESLELQQKKASLEKRKEDGSVNPDVVELLKGNTSHVRLLHSLINQLFSHVREKMELMENILEETKSNQEM